MKIQCEIEQLEETGIYQIINLIDNKMYIGSARKSFRIRFQHHINSLLRKDHKNTYLQNQFNKHGSENFEIRIIEICKKEICLEREQYWLDLIKSYDHTIGYNINPKATGNSMTQESNQKRSDTMKQKYQNGEMKHVIAIISGREPWNKNKKYETTTHLKVPKRKKGNRNKDKETKRNNSKSICVYKDNILLGIWRSPQDLEEYSLSESCDLPIVPEKIRKQPKLLSQISIHKACKTGKLYKNLKFEYGVPLSTEMQIE